MTKTCPHCHCEFDCRNDNILECDCVHVILSKEALNYISSRYADCLCVDCLQEINCMEASTRRPEEAAQHNEAEQHAKAQQFEDIEQYDVKKVLITNDH